MTSMVTWAGYVRSARRVVKCDSGHPLVRQRIDYAGIFDEPPVSLRGRRAGVKMGLGRLPTPMSVWT